MKYALILMLLVAVVATLVAADQYEEDGFIDDTNNSLESDGSDESSEIDEVVRVARSARARGNQRRGKSCRYNKGPWSECDNGSNTRSRTLTLKKGDNTCEASKTITKKCKNAKKGGRRNRN